MILNKIVLLKSTHRQQLEQAIKKLIANSQAIVARNLYFQGKEVTEHNVKEEVQRIMYMREVYRDIPVFSGRNVVFAAHSEQKGNDAFGDLNRFGKQALVDRIRQDGGNIDGVLRPSNMLESLKGTKQKILEAIKTTPPPFTFVFQGHGGPDALYLSDGQTVKVAGYKIFETRNTVKITVRELFEAYKIRQGRFSDKTNTPETRDIFIHPNCYSSNFIRNFYIMCDETDIQKPIFTGESEYGQYGFSEYSSKYGDRFFDGIFNGSDIQRATLGNIIDNDSRNQNSNPSLSISTKRNRTMQLSRNEEGQTDESQFA